MHGVNPRPNKYVKSKSLLQTQSQCKSNGKMYITHCLVRRRARNGRAAGSGLLPLTVLYLFAVNTGWTANAQRWNTFKWKWKIENTYEKTRHIARPHCQNSNFIPALPRVQTKRIFSFKLQLFSALFSTKHRL